MDILILDGGPRDGRGQACRSINDRVVRGARQRGWNVTAFGLDGMAIKPCVGCFACWLKHPGTCAIKDDEAAIHRAMAKSDISVWITPVTFGGYSPALKKALDRSIPIALPYFIRVQGEIHHPPRYPKRLGLMVFGTLASPCEEAERIFHRLVQRNGLNLGSSMTESRILYDGADGDGIDSLVEGMLRAAEEAR